MVAPGIRVTITEAEAAASLPRSDTVIGVVGTSHTGGPDPGSINLIRSIEDREIFKHNSGSDGTLYQHITDIQANVLDDIAAIPTGIKSGTTTTEVDALDLMLEVESSLGKKPTILIVPGKTWGIKSDVPVPDINAVVTKIDEVAEKLGGIGIAGGPQIGATVALKRAGVISWANNNRQDRVLGVYPHIKDNAAGDARDPAAVVAGAIALADHEDGIQANLYRRAVQGFGLLDTAVSYSPVNQEGSDSALLAQANITPIVRHNGYFLGLCRFMVDPATSLATRFVGVRRVIDNIRANFEDDIADILTGNITPEFYDRVTARINNRLAFRVTSGQLTSGSCYADAAKNTTAARASGRSFFIVRIVPIFPSQAVEFGIEVNIG